MIIDTSAVLAILLEEVERSSFEQLMVQRQNAMSAGSWVELAAVITRRKHGMAEERLLRFFDRLRIRIVPVTHTQAILGHRAYRTYGIGSGHRARLNFGDCFAYALAKETGEPLLFKGDDFVHTDIVAAV